MPRGVGRSLSGSSTVMRPTPNGSAGDGLDLDASLGENLARRR